jgi:hypothetical protein
MQIVIDISEEVYQFLQKTSFTEDENTIFKQTNEDRKKTLFLFDILDAIRNGTPLPKGHGRLIDADAFERRCMFDSDIEDMQDVIYALRDYKPIIEADKE